MTRATASASAALAAAAACRSSEQPLLLLLVLLLATACTGNLEGYAVRRGMLRQERSGDGGETGAIDRSLFRRRQQHEEVEVQRRQYREPAFSLQPPSSASTRPRTKWRHPRRAGSRTTRGFEPYPSRFERSSDGGGGEGGNENATDSGDVIVVMNPLDSANDDGWSEWSDWQLAGHCSTTCDEGIVDVSRNRSCTLEYLGCEGDGAQTEIRECNNFPCLMYGTWGEWRPWTTTGCSVTCSIGIKVMIRWRDCDPRTATEHSLGCLGPSSAMYTQSCKVAVPCGVGQPDALASNATSDSPEPSPSGPLYAVIISTLVGVPLTIALACSVGALAHAVCLPEMRRRRQERLLASSGGSGSVSGGASPAATAVAAAAEVRDGALTRRTECRCAIRSLVVTRTPPPCCAAAVDRLSRPARPSWDML